MVNVSLLLTGEEWSCLSDQAKKQFPGENLSRSEVCRRYALEGLRATKDLGQWESTRRQYHHQKSMTAADWERNLRSW
jgi:hypothetical protein